MYKITDICDGCGVCASSCPLDLIVQAGDVYEICIGCNVCGSCSALCPRGAIKRI